MEQLENARKIKKTITGLAADIEALGVLGKDMPAVEKNAARLRGTLRALEIQFNLIEFAEEV